MSIISEVKCARCDRQYTGVRSRCPYCGARRIGKGKYSEDIDNSKGKMIIGISIMALLVVAAGVLLFTAPQPDVPAVPSDSINSIEPTGSFGDERDNNTFVNPSSDVTTSPSPSDEPEESTSPTVPVQVQSVTITYAGYPIADFSEPTGKEIPLGVRVEPAGVEFSEVIWESSDRGIFEVVKTNLDGTAAKVTIIGTRVQSFAILTVRVGDVEATCYVRVGSR